MRTGRCLRPSGGATVGVHEAGAEDVRLRTACLDIATTGAPVMSRGMVAHAGGLHACLAGGNRRCTVDVTPLQPRQGRVLSAEVPPTSFTQSGTWHTAEATGVRAWRQTAREHPSRVCVSAIALVQLAVQPSPRPKPQGSRRALQAGIPGWRGWVGRQAASALESLVHSSPLLRPQLVDGAVSVALVGGSEACCQTPVGLSVRLWRRRDQP